MIKQEPYFIPINGNLIEVTAEVYKEYYRLRRSEEYRLEQEKENGVFSYDALDNGELVGEEIFSDPDEKTVEEKVLSQELFDLLHRCISALPTTDQQLIRAIYFEGKSERSYAKDIDLSKSTINYRHDQILTKLRLLMNILGSI